MWKTFENRTLAAFVRAFGKYHEGDGEVEGSGECRYIKLHLLNHYAQLLQWFGSPALFYTGHFEKAHRWFAKLPFERAGGSRDDKVLYMQKRVELARAVHRRKTQLEWARNNLRKGSEKMGPGMEEDGNSAGGVDNEGINCLIKEIDQNMMPDDFRGGRVRGPSYILTNEKGCDRSKRQPDFVRDAALHRVQEALRRVGAEGPYPSQLEIHTEYAVPQKGLLLRSDPYFRGGTPWRDFCYVKHTTGKDFICKLWGFVSIKGVKDLALVQWYWKVQSDRQKHPFLVHWKRLEERDKCDAVPVDTITRTAYCLPFDDHIHSQIWEVPGVSQIVKDGEIPLVGDEDCSVLLRFDT